MYKIFHCFVNPEEIQMLEPVAQYTWNSYYPTVSIHFKGREKPVQVTGAKSFKTSDEAFEAAVKECELKEDDY